MGRTGQKRSLEGSSGEEPRHKVFYIKFSVFVCDDKIEISIYMEFSSNLILTYSASRTDLETRGQHGRRDDCEGQA